MEFCFVKLYGPYNDRETFWDNLFSKECLIVQNMILGRDLNFSLGLSKVWGPMGHDDSLSEHFTRKLEEVGLLDIELIKIIPTWTNKRSRYAIIGKRLYRFFCL